MVLLVSFNWTFRLIFDLFLGHTFNLRVLCFKCNYFSSHSLSLPHYVYPILLNNDLLRPYLILFFPHRRLLSMLSSFSLWLNVICTTRKIHGSRKLRLDSHSVFENKPGKLLKNSWIFFFLNFTAFLCCFSQLWTCNASPVLGSLLYRTIAVLWESCHNYSALPSSCWCRFIFPVKFSSLIFRI